MTGKPQTDLEQEMVRNLAQPLQLERLYRANPAEFEQRLPGLAASHPDSLVLESWRARLFYDDLMPDGRAGTIRRWWDIALIVLLCLAAGTLANLPNLMGMEEAAQVAFYERNVGLIVLPFITAYLLVKRRPSRKLTLLLAALTIVAAVFINLVPTPEGSDTVLLACIHLPLVLWALAGLAYTGDAYRDVPARLGYLGLNGETIPYTAIVLISGGLLTGLTFALFEAIDVDVERFMEHVVVYGAASAPIVAAALAYVRGLTNSRIAPVIARIFSPLVLITLLVYLGTMAVLQKSVYTDRDFLLIFNLMLAAVLALSIFSLSGRNATAKRGAGSVTNVALIGTALVLNTIALSAILFRLASYGFTPNRIAVLGANVLIFGCLAGILILYIQYLRRKVAFAAIERWIAGYLTVFVAWAAFITFVFPFLYAFA